MYNNNLTELLKTFSLKETKEFREFLKSSYFNKRQAVSNLYEILIKFYPDFENKSLTKEKVFGKMFPGKKYNDSSLRVLAHYLTELAEKFLAFKRFEMNKLEFTLQLEQELSERNQNKLFEKNLNRAFEYLDEIDLESEIYLYYKYRLENDKTYYRFVANYANYEKVLHESDWENVFTDFNNYYILKLMLMYLNTVNYYSLYNKKFKSEIFRNAFDNIKINDYKDIPVIQMYYYLIKMNTESEHSEFYFKLKEILLKNKSKLNKFDLTGAYVNMGAYCSNRISEGNMDFEKERFELYKEEIEEKTYLLNDNSMSPIFYRNAVRCALELNETAWVKNFINSFKPELNKKFRDNYYYYCLALYEFNVKNFEYSLELISKIRYDEIYMKLNSKTLHLQLLYELNYEDSLVDALESFRHFLNNNKLIPDIKKLPFSNFYKYLNRILSVKNKKSKSEFDLLRSEILKEKNLINESWLLKKVES